jgi:hypothetical protein
VDDETIQRRKVKAEFEEAGVNSSADTSGGQEN